MNINEYVCEITFWRFKVRPLSPTSHELLSCVCSVLFYIYIYVVFFQVLTSFSEVDNINYFSKFDFAKKTHKKRYILNDIFIFFKYNERERERERESMSIWDEGSNQHSLSRACWKLL